MFFRDVIQTNSSSFDSRMTSLATMKYYETAKSRNFSLAPSALALKLLTKNRITHASDLFGRT